MTALLTLDVSFSAMAMSAWGRQHWNAAAINGTAAATAVRGIAGSSIPDSCLLI